MRIVLGIVSCSGKICPRPQSAFPVKAERIRSDILGRINVAPVREHIAPHFHGWAKNHYSCIAPHPDITIRHTDDIVDVAEPVPSQIHFGHFSGGQAYAEKPLHRTYEQLAVRHYDKLVYPPVLEDRFIEQRDSRLKAVIRNVQIAITYIRIASSPGIKADTPRIAV